MMRPLLIVFAGLALSVASAETYHVKLFQSTTVQGTELKAGEYRMDLQNDNQITILNGKQKLDVPVKVERSEKNFGVTTVRYTVDSGKYSLREIQLGGTKTKLVFGAETKSGGGQ